MNSKWYDWYDILLKIETNESPLFSSFVFNVLFVTDDLVLFDKSLWNFENFNACSIKFNYAFGKYVLFTDNIYRLHTCIYLRSSNIIVLNDSFIFK